MKEIIAGIFMLIVFIFICYYMYKVAVDHSKEVVEMNKEYNDMKKLEEMDNNHLTWTVVTRDPEDLELPTTFESEPTDLEVEEMCRNVYPDRNIVRLYRFEMLRFSVCFDDGWVYGYFSLNFKYVRFSKT